MPSHAPQPNARAASDMPLFVGLAAVVGFFVVSGFVAYWNTRTLSRSTERLARTREVHPARAGVRSLMKDAETGQRGYLIPGAPRYLDPHTLAVVAVKGRLDDLDRHTRDSPDQQARLPLLRGLIDAKLNELGE